MFFFFFYDISSLQVLFFTVDMSIKRDDVILYCEF